MMKRLGTCLTSSHPFLPSHHSAALQQSHLPIYLVYMSTTSEPSMFESLFQSALEEFEKQTKINLAEHPLAAQLERCNSVQSITELLHDQARTFRQFRANDSKLMTVLNRTAQGLHTLSGIMTVGGAVGFVCRNRGWVLHYLFLTLLLQQVPFVKSIHTGIGVLLSVRIPTVSVGESL